DEGYAEPIQHEPSVMRQRAFGLRRGKMGAWVGRMVLGLVAAAFLGTLVFYGARLASKIKWTGPKAETAATDSSATYQPIVVGDKYQHLILKGLDKSWVLVTMDDGQASSEVDLDQGETKTYKALKSFKLKLGNAGGVQVQFNGKPLGVLGTTGQVVEIQLPPGPGGSDDADSGT
ncbi:MAG TPA: DUF4115 domain-containing protein, partial [bacterium]|nr:DUF4115 domain-containing protein [bacterium]